MDIQAVKDPTFVEKLKHLLQSINNTALDTDLAYNLDIENALKSIQEGNFIRKIKPKQSPKNGEENNLVQQRFRSIRRHSFLSFL
jgi:hypothetical protein